MNRIHHFIKLIKESIDVEDLTDSDFFDIFVTAFKEWMNQKKPEVNKRLAFSYLLRKYGQEFLLDMNLIDRESDYDDYSSGIDSWDIKKFGKELVKKGIVEMPEFVASEERFLDLYKKGFDLILSRVPLPSYAKYHFEEKNPFNLFGNINVDVNKMIRSEEKLRPQSSYRSDIEKYLENYLGIEFGESKYGLLNFYFHDIVFDNFEQFKKKELKEIKSELKKIDMFHIVHSLKVEVGRGEITIKITFKNEDRKSTRLNSSH